jgi:hypothetical protein
MVVAACGGSMKISWRVRILTGIGLVLALLLIGRSLRKPDEFGSITAERTFTYALVFGLLAMATVEVVKRLTPVRAIYARRYLATWLNWRLEGVPEGRQQAIGQLIQALQLSPETDGLETAELGGQWIRWRHLWLWGRGVSGPFNLPTEQLVAQISAALERCTQNPDQYTALLQAFAPGVDLDRPTDDVEPSGSGASSGKRRRRRRKPDGEPPASRPDSRRLDFAEESALTLDQLQTMMGGTWRAAVRAVACLLSGGFAAWAVGSNQFLEVNSNAYILTSLVLGGFLAWTARDVAAIIERLRR